MSFPAALVWGITVAVWLASFAVLETVALLDRSPNNTLSRQVRRVLRWRRWFWRLSLVVWVAFVSWLTVHLWFG